MSISRHVNFDFGDSSKNSDELQEWLLLDKCYLESQMRPEQFTRKAMVKEKVKKPKKQAIKINSCFIKVVNEITLDGILLIYH